jgi:hypothetical protein
MWGEKPTKFHPVQKENTMTDFIETIKRALKVAHIPAQAKDLLEHMADGYDAEENEPFEETRERLLAALEDGEVLARMEQAIAWPGAGIPDDDEHAAEREAAEAQEQEWVEAAYGLVDELPSPEDADERFIKSGFPQITVEWNDRIDADRIDAETVVVHPTVTVSNLYGTSLVYDDAAIRVRKGKVSEVWVNTDAAEGECEDLSDLGFENAGELSGAIEAAMTEAVEGSKNAVCNLYFLAQ